MPLGEIKEVTLFVFINILGWNPSFFSYLLIPFDALGMSKVGGDDKTIIKNPSVASLHPQDKDLNP